MSSITELEGKVFKEVKEVGDEIHFISDTESYRMYHPQDCCESVYIEDICGYLGDLEDVVIEDAREDFEDGKDSEYGYIQGWTFYNFRTIKGSVTIRWYGSSNGYYGIGVYIEKL